MQSEVTIDLADHVPAAPARRSGWRRSAFGTLGTGSALIAGQAATGLAMLILARRTSPSEFGAFVALYGVTIAVGGIIDFGSSSRLTIDLAKGLDTRKVIPWLTRRMLFQLPVVLLLGAAALAYADDRLPRLCVIALCGQAMTWAIAHGVLGAVRAVKSPVSAEWMVAAGNVVTLVTVVVVPGRHLLTAAAIASYSSWVICGGIGAWTMATMTVPWSPSKRTNPWTGSVSFGFASLAAVLQGFVLLIVERTSSAEQAGSLGAVQKWTQPISLLAVAYSGFLFPSLAAALTDRLAIKMLRTLVLVLAVGCAVGAAVVALAPFLIRTLLGAEYVPAAHVLRLLVIVSVPELVIQPLSVLLQSRGMQRRVAWTMMALAVGSLTSIALLASHMGNTAVPFVEGICNGTALIVFGVSTRRMWIANRDIAVAPS